MIKKPMTYKDYNGNMRTEDFYFGLNKAELLEMDFGMAGGFEASIQRIISEQDMKKIYAIFKDFVLKSYGEKSLDGKYFVKNQELRDKFVQTEAFSDLIIELLSDSKMAADFLTGIMPDDIDETVRKAVETRLRNHPIGADNALPAADKQ